MVSLAPAQPQRWSNSPPKIDASVIRKRDETEDSSTSFEAQMFKDQGFMARVRDWLKTDEQRKFFDFIIDVPTAFAMHHAGSRWTEEKVALHLGIPVDRIPTLKKALRRAFQRQIRLLPQER